jgi:hypothetical protein
MLPATPLPRAGEIYLDARSPSRALRVSWHEEAGVVVLSLWRANVCVSTFQLPVEEVPDLVDVLRAGLDASYTSALAHRRATRLSDAG